MNRLFPCRLAYLFICALVLCSCGLGAMPVAQQAAASPTLVESAATGTAVLLAPTVVSPTTTQATAELPVTLPAPPTALLAEAPQAAASAPTRATTDAAAYPYPAPANPTPTTGVYPGAATAQPGNASGAYPAPTATRTPLALLFPFVAPGAMPVPGAPQIAAAQPSVARAGFVSAQGNQLMLDGRPYYFLGVNATYLTLTYFLDDQIEPIIAYLAQTQGVNVIRLFFTPGQSLDRLQLLLDLGQRYNVRYIVALQNYHYHKSQSWFAERYKEEDLPHLRATVARFRDRPEILMWELMNEPSCGPENGSRQCVDHMYNWAQAVSLGDQAA